MSPTDENTSSESDHRFDLLVDGELSEAQRRELLVGLDDEPGGWRRCALAFLEAQSWKQEFRVIAREPLGTPPARQPVGRLHFGRYTGTLLAMAASFAAALLVGSLFREVWPPGHAAGPQPRQVVDGTPGAPNPVVPPGHPDGVTPAVPQPPGAAFGPWRLVGNSQSIQLPATERDTIDQRWLESLPTAMPDDVLRALQRHGYQVQQRRRLLPLRMRDGRPLVVPVDEVDVHYIGNPAL